MKEGKKQIVFLGGGSEGKFKSRAGFSRFYHRD